MSGEGFGVREIRIGGFRSARSVRFEPGPICGLIGGPSVGKSNVLAAIWMLLQHAEQPPSETDLSAGNAAPIQLAATLRDGEQVTLEASPPGQARRRGRQVPVLFMPASQRSGRLVRHPLGTSLASRVARRYFAVEEGLSSAAPAVALVEGLQALCATGDGGLVLLIEEPELFLRPQAQRYLYRLLREFAGNGNQVVYSTHEPAFLNVGRLDELALVEHSAQTGTVVIQPQPLPADESFRALSELDAERGELFLARAVLLVEGRTEKLSFPFIFMALGYDADREAITIVDCGGKPNIPLFIRICHAARIPCLAVHDRDAPPGRSPSHAESDLNRVIAELSGDERPVVLSPDFEAVAGLRGHRHKPARAWQRFSGVQPTQVPDALRYAVSRAVELARG